VTLGVAVAVAVGVGVCGVGVGVGVPHMPSLRGAGTHAAILTVSTRQPSPEPLMSLAIRQRSRAPCVAKMGMLTTVVMNPAELPLQA
jgi:hypothetical protein